jgi:hypothetical protein
VVDDQHVARLRLDRARDPLPVLRAEDERAQDEQVERALQMGGVLAVGAFRIDIRPEYAQARSNVNPMDRRAATSLTRDQNAPVSPRRRTPPRPRRPSAAPGAIARDRTTLRQRPRLLERQIAPRASPLRAHQRSTCSSEPKSIVVA